MGQWLRELIILEEEAGLVPSTHVVGLTSVPGDLMLSSGLSRFLHASGAHKLMYAEMHIKMNKIKN